VRGLYLKIFLCFWAAQSVIVLLSAEWIIRQRYEKADASADALFSSLQTQGDLAVGAYQRGGCAGLMEYRASQDQNFQLTDSTMRPVCGEVAQHDYAPLLQRYRQVISRHADVGHRFGQIIGDSYVWDVPLTMNGDEYFFVLMRPYESQMGWYRDLRDLAYPQFGVAILVCGLTTLVLVMLLTRPIRRLRSAARNLAEGRLSSRVEWVPPRSSVFSGDEIQGLVTDFNYMAERLESLVETHRMLLRDVSHELRSPLARLTMALELGKDDANEETRQHLQNIEREAARLHQLIVQLLTLSQLDAMGNLECPTQFRLEELLQDILPDAQFEARHRGCSVEMTGLADCPMHGQPELIYRAIENIVRNAIRYTKEGSVVEIRLDASEENGNAGCALEIADRGPGIPEDQLEAIFKPFYRIDAARQRATGGFGVGLAIADRAVRLHAGRLQALNRPDGGAILRMWLPCNGRLPPASTAAGDNDRSHFVSAGLG
jgi:two-component system sensor histidine kinase CpxA